MANNRLSLSLVTDDQDIEYWERTQPHMEEWEEEFRESKIKHVVAVVGSRNFTDEEYFILILDKLILLHAPDELRIVAGGEAGTDALAENYAKENGIEFREYPADWDKYRVAGKKNIAGTVRNKQMISDCDECIAFWDGKSPGTRDAIKLCKANRKYVQIVQID